VVLDVRELTDAVSRYHTAPSPEILGSIEVAKYYAYDSQLLNPSETCAHSFIVSLPKHLEAHRGALIAAGCAEVVWSSPFGEGGTVRGSESSPFQGTEQPAASSSVSITCVTCPATAIVNRPFDAVVRIANLSRQAMTLRLSAASRRTNSSTDSLSFEDKLTVIGVSNIDIGSVDVGCCVDKTLLVYPSSSGLQELKGLVVADSLGREHESGTLAKVLVVEQRKDGEQDN
jgi:hypothetical protein